MKNKLKNICDFYAITHKLKNTMRQGWVNWKIDSKRIESVAEHIYGTQMLCFAIDCEFDLNLDIQKVALMLAMHELGETIVGDITMIDNVTPEEKHKKEMEAVTEILAPMSSKEKIFQLYLEFDQNKTKEAKFAHSVDKLECDFQAKFYEETGCTDFVTPREGVLEKIRLDSIALGYKTLAHAWIKYTKKHFDYDELFSTIADYLIENKIFDK